MPAAFARAAHPDAGVVQDLEIQLGTPGASAMRSGDAVRRGCQEHIRDDVGQLLRLFLIEAALGDPGCAQADAGWVEGKLVAGDGIAVDHDAGHIQDAGSVVAGEGGAIRTLDRGHVHVEHVRIRPAEGNAEAAFLQAFGDRQWHS